MKRALLASVALAAALGVALGAYVLHVRHAGRDVTGSPTVEFVPPRPAPAEPKPTARRVAVPWPSYGRGPARLRAIDGTGLRPPFKRVWTWHGGALLEFPPVVAGGRLFIATFDGRMYGLDARTGRAVWRFDTHRCGWASPAIAGPLVIEAFIGSACGRPVPGRDGAVIAFDRASGAIRWRRTLGPTESSPLVVGSSVYTADWNGRVTRRAAATGRRTWTTRVGGPLKSSPAIAAGTLYIGSYDGHVYALDARTGTVLWRASGQPRLGAGGSFYATPAVDYDRVYVGSTDGKVYSYGAETGRLRWSQSTGGYVYASAAVWDGLVLVGSYSHIFAAFDAATGVRRWTFHANGPISGAASVVDGVVYFSTFAHTTYGLDATTGKQLWRWPDGEYSPVVTDGRMLYLTGRGRLYGLITSR